MKEKKIKININKIKRRLEKDGFFEVTNIFHQEFRQEILNNIIFISNKRGTPSCF